MVIVMAAVVVEDMDTHMGAVVPKMQKMGMTRNTGMPMKLPTRRTST